MAELHLADTTERHAGCHAPVIYMEDGSVGDLPVCLGGVIISGCNDAETCIPLAAVMREKKEEERMRMQVRKLILDADQITVTTSAEPHIPPATS